MQQEVEQAQPEDARASGTEGKFVNSNIHRLSNTMPQ
jgi:hypothetical protein